MTDLRDEIPEDDNLISPEELEATADIDMSSDDVEARSEPETEEEEVVERGSWYVVHSYSGMENKVKKNLEHRIESMRMSDKIYQVIYAIDPIFSFKL